MKTVEDLELYVHNAIIDIKDAAIDDDERAHGLEDRLREKVLHFLVELPQLEFEDCAESIQSILCNVLNTKNIPFSRWCA